MISDAQARVRLSKWLAENLDGENLSEASRACGTNVKSMRNYRDGKSWPTGPTLLVLAHYLREPLPSIY